MPKETALLVTVWAYSAPNRGVLSGKDWPIDLFGLLERPSLPIILEGSIASYRLYNAPTFFT